MFWIAACALLALALAFVAWPLARGRGQIAPRFNRPAVMRALYRDRVAELDAEVAAGQVEEETRAEVVDELGAILLEEYQTDESTADAAPPRRAGAGPGMALWAVLVLLPLGGLGVYLSSGEPDASTVAGATEVLTLDPRTDTARLESWRDRLARRVQRRPHDGQSWYLLGVSRLQLGEFAAAADAFASANDALGDDPSVNLYWLQARYLAAGGRLDDRSRALAAQLLEARPNHPLVLEMFAIDAYRQGDYRAAVEHLNAALNSPMPAARQMALLAGLERARAELGTLTPAIDVSVSAPAQAPREGTVFVIARPPEGGMPYAVVRRSAALLPLSVRLDDTTTMGGRKLSGAGAIQVVVRLSRSGAPSATPGDWEWRSGVLDLDAGDQPVALDAELAPWEGGEP